MDGAGASDDIRDRSHGGVARARNWRCLRGAGGWRHDLVARGAGPLPRAEGAEAARAGIEWRLTRSWATRIVRRTPRGCDRKAHATAPGQRCRSEVHLARRGRREAPFLSLGHLLHVTIGALAHPLENLLAEIVVGCVEVSDLRRVIVVLELDDARTASAVAIAERDEKLASRGDEVG